MAAGDVQRVWWTGMVEALEQWWNGEVPWPEFIDFCGRMMDLRKTIRDERGIKAPMIHCKKCGCDARMDIPGISVRSTLFALKNAGKISDDEFKELERSWKRHQRSNALDGYGRKKGNDKHRHN